MSEVPEKFKGLLEGEGMNRLDEAIKTVGYILDTLIAYRNIISTGCCNECDDREYCGFAPKPGQLVRYNCPFFERRANG